MRAAYVVIGLLAVFVGIYFLRHHALSFFLLAFVTGVFFIAHGISDIGLAISASTPNRGLRAVLGVFSLAAGIIMVIWPGITLVLLLTIVAAWLLFYGVVLAVLSFSIRRAGKDAEKMSMPSQRLAAGSRASREDSGRRRGGRQDSGFARRRPGEAALRAPRSPTCSGSLAHAVIAARGAGPGRWPDAGSRRLASGTRS